MSARRIFAQGRRETRFGHGAYLSPIATIRTVDNQDEVVRNVLRERARRALCAV